MKRDVSADGGGALFRTLVRLWPYIWPSDRRDLQWRVVWSTVLLFGAKLATVAVPFTFKWAIDALTGQGDEGVGLIEHPLFALVHVAGDDHFGAPVGVLAVLQKRRDDADDRAAAVEYRTGKLAHQSNRAAAIDESDAVVGKDRPEGARGRDESRVRARARAAIHANPLQSAHSSPI